MAHRTGSHPSGQVPPPDPTAILWSAIGVLTSASPDDLDDPTIRAAVEVIHEQASHLIWGRTNGRPVFRR